jgi:hypothetical protein
MKLRTLMPISIGYKLSQYDLLHHLTGNLVQEICHGHQTSHLCSSLLPDDQRHASACLRPFQKLAESLSETDAGVSRHQLRTSS